MNSVGESQAQAEGFAALGLGQELLAVLTELGYEEPTPVQQAAIPALLAGRDVLAQAATGTGKTAAFSLPILDRMEVGRGAAGAPSMLVIAPTRELAVQVAEALTRYGSKRGIAVVAVYGGQDISRQLKPLRRAVDVVVATPGRAIDHLRRKSLRLDAVKSVVLDEADEMLDMGFADELDEILKALPAERQTALFSATLPPRIAKLAETHLRNPVRVRIQPKATSPGSLPKIRQTAYMVPRSMKELALARVLEVEQPHSAILFCRTRLEVDRLAELLSRHGHAVAALHGGLTQEQRDRVLQRFKGEQVQMLIATDVAARGLDVEHLSHVVNYDLPTSPEPYVHRIGRTGRAGREGVAISLFESRELRLLRNIERVTGQPVALAQPPTPEQLREFRLAKVRELIETGLRAEPVADLWKVVQELSSTAAPEQIAAAALGALLAARHPSQADDQIRIPDASAKAAYAGPPTERQRRLESSRQGDGRDRWSSRDQADAPARSSRPERGLSFSGPGAARAPREASGPGASREGYGAPRAPRDAAGPSRGPARGRPAMGPSARLFVGLGETAGLRPADLVGALANEGGLSSKEIGAIEIFPHHAFVELPAHTVDEMADVLRGATLRGRRVKVERDRSTAPRAPRKTRGPRQG